MLGQGFIRQREPRPSVACREDCPGRGLGNPHGGANGLVRAPPGKHMGAVNIPYGISRRAHAAHVAGSAASSPLGSQSREPEHHAASSVFTPQQGFDPELCSRLAAPPQVFRVVPPPACRGLLNGFWVPRTAWPAAAAACLPTREQCLQACCCPNNWRAVHRKLLLQECAS
jgi:hypothetical protein